MNKNMIIKRNGIGGLRHLSDYMIFGQENDPPDEIYMNWLAADTETVLNKAEHDFNEWFEKAFLDYESCNKAFDVIWPFINANKQEAFERGAKFGATILHELIK